MQPLFKRKIKMFFIYWINEALGIFPKSFNEAIRALILLLISLVITDQTLGSAALEQKLEKGSIDFFITFCSCSAVHYYPFSFCFTILSTFQN
jgi:hypothetical protein